MPCCQNQYRETDIVCKSQTIITLELYRLEAEYCIKRTFSPPWSLMNSLPIYNHIHCTWQTKHWQTRFI